MNTNEFNEIIDSMTDKLNITRNDLDSGASELTEAPDEVSEYDANGNLIRMETFKSKDPDGIA